MPPSTACATSVASDTAVQKLGMVACGGEMHRLGAADTAATTDTCQRWYTLVESLAQESLKAEAVQELLQAACSAARADAGWADSGIIELLSRAEEAARAGYTDIGRMKALGLLDFKKTVERLRQAAAGSGTGSGTSEGKRSSATCFSSGDEAVSEDDVAANASKRRRNDQGDTTAATTSMDAPTSTVSRRKRCEQTATWSGAVKVKTPGTGACTEFCRVKLEVPEPVLAGLPRELVVSSIKQRKTVAGMPGLTCSTCITAAGPEQVAELRKMAQLQLVAVVPLEDCGAILVPYLAESGQLRAVTFLTTME